MAQMIVVRCKRKDWQVGTQFTGTVEDFQHPSQAKPVSHVKMKVVATTPCDNVIILGRVGGTSLHFFWDRDLKAYRASLWR